MKTLKRSIIYIYISIINMLVINYVDIKNLIKNVKKTSIKYLIFEFKYKKLLIEIFKEIHNNIDVEIKKLIYVILVIKYMFKKYLCNYSFFELSKYYIKNLDITNLKLHLENKLDIYLILKNKTEYIIKSIPIILLYLIRVYYFNNNKFYSLVCVYLKNRRTYNILKKLNYTINVKITNLILHHKELKFLIKFFYKTDYIILSNLNKHFFI